MAGDKEQALRLLFQRIEIRDALSEEEKRALFEAAGEFRHHHKGSNIVEEGDRSNVSTLLVSGLASRFNVMEDGGRQITAIHVPGDFVDLHSFPLKLMDHSIGALADCVVLQFPHANLSAITERYPHLTRLLWMLTLLDGAIHRRWLVAMGRTSATSHMAHLLCETYMRLEAVGMARDFRMSLPITQLELADVLGISAVHANRTLQELRTQGVIGWTGTEVSILDWERLAGIGEFNDQHLFREQMPR